MLDVVMIVRDELDGMFSNFFLKLRLLRYIIYLLKALANE
jgi:hypothetical protein